MPKPLTIPGHVNADGTPSGVLERNVTNALRLWADSDVQVTVSSRGRSINANSYYWGVVLEHVTAFLNAAGYTLEKQDTHDMLKRWFLPARVVEVPSMERLDTVETVTAYGSTRTDSFTFAEYVNKIREHEPFARDGLYIPEPNEKVTGRTIHEPGGGKVTFRDPKEPAPEREPVRAETQLEATVRTMADLW